MRITLSNNSRRATVNKVTFRIGVFSILLILLSLVPTVNVAQTNFPPAVYVFATNTFGESLTLNYLTVSSLEIVKSLNIIKPYFSESVVTFVSPNGAYILIAPTGFRSEGTSIILFTVEDESVDILSIPIHSERMTDYTRRVTAPSPLIAWSPDSQKFAVISGSGDGVSNIVIYDVLSNQSTILNASPKQYANIAWSNDNEYVAVNSENCSEGCQASVDIYNVSTTTLINSYDILDEYFLPLFGSICNLTWSPDSQYISFVSVCDSSQFVIFKEVYVLDVSSGQLTNATHLTDVALPMTNPPNSDIVGRFAFYGTAWLDNIHLLIGATYAVDRTGNLVTETFLYDNTANTLTSLSNYRGSEFARLSQTSSTFAIASANSDQQLTNVRIVDLSNPLSLNELSLLPFGCNLTWSHSDEILAYLRTDRLTEDCRGFLSSLFFWDSNQNTISEYPVDPSLDVHPIGWIVLNQSPSSSAGLDQTFADNDNSGSESVTLDGSASTDSDGTIVSYMWTENEVEIATGATPTVDLAVGTHTITLTVTDDDGLTATDEVVITVNAPPAFGVTSLTLINADTDTDIRTVSSTGTETIDIASNDISLRADTDPATVGSVVFSVDGNVVATDNSAPYTIAGENGSDILPWNFALGQHTVVATPYSGADGTGDAGTPLTVQVNIVDSSFAVSSLTLVNATTNADIRTLSTSVTETVDIANNGISVRANTNPATVGSVVFRLDGTNIKTESIAPYTIAGDQSNGTDYLPWNIAPGMYTLTVTPYSATGGGGNAGTPMTVQLEIINSIQQNLSIENFYLVNADTDTDIGILQDGAVIDIGTQNINIRAATNSPNVASVRLNLNGHPDYRIETASPYALGENDPGVFAPWLTPPGQYTLIATAYDGANATGNAGVPRTVNFTITNSTATCGGLSQEAENGTLVGTMVSANDASASNGAYIHVPSINRFVLSGRDRAFYCFTIPQSGTYRLRAWVYAATSGNDSLYVEVDDDESLWDVLQNTTYAQDYVNDRLGNDPTEYTLSAGEHWVTIYGREAGARTDRLEFELVSAANEQAIYRVDAGNANSYTDDNGRVWEADNYFTGGTANNFPANDILNTSDDDLYETERSQSNNTGFSYSFPVTNGDYTVRLHFAEVWFVGGSGRGTLDTGSPPRRVFDVQIEGVTVLDEFHIVTAAGGVRTAHVETFNVTVTDGSLDINFPPATTDNPTIEAIEIVQVNGQ